jgi:1,4-alpha-glucan branching enzyme
MPKVAEYRGTESIRAQIAPERVEVTFSLDRSGAQEVYLCGDFNQWSPTSLRMIRQGASDRWAKRLTLAPGRYQYKFVVDGKWVHDPEASENVSNQHGSLNSVVEVPE